MFEVGRHDAHTRAHQAARYRLRKGMAEVALQHKTGKRPAADHRGVSLKYATEMAERHSIHTLSRWAAGSSTTVVGSGMDFCPVCHRVPEVCQCP